MGFLRVNAAWPAQIPGIRRILRRPSSHRPIIPPHWAILGSNRQSHEPDSRRQFPETGARRCVSVTSLPNLEEPHAVGASVVRSCSFGFRLPLGAADGLQPRGGRRPWIAVSAVSGLEADGGFSPDLRRQTERCVERIREALDAFDAQLDDIIRVRIYTTCIDRWEEIAAVMDRRSTTFGPRMSSSKSRRSWMRRS